MLKIVNKFNWKKNTIMWNYCKNFKNNMKREIIDVLDILDVEMGFILFEKNIISWVFKHLVSLRFTNPFEDHSH